MRRVMLLALLALALPTATLAGTIGFGFDTGTFVSGSFFGVNPGEPFGMEVVGNLFTIDVSSSLVTFNMTTGVIGFSTGTVVVTNPAGKLVFKDSLSGGVFDFNEDGFDVEANLVPNA